jgi:DNA-binding transcriptional LysR family regulator
MTDLKLLEAFVLAMRHGSLSAAEAQSGIPKATLSRLIARLEEQLGTQLFLRAARRAVPTEAGSQFYLRAQHLLDQVTAEFEEARALVQNLKDEISGKLAISTVSYLSTSYLTNILSLYMQRHPAVVCHLDIVSGLAAPIADNVDCHVWPTQPVDASLSSLLLGNLQCRLFATPRYLEQHGVPRTPEDLASHKGLVARRQRSDLTLELTKNGQTAQCTMAAGCSTNDYWIMKTMVIDGYGIAVLPEFFARPEVECGILRPVLRDWRAPDLPIYCTYPRKRQVGRKLGALIELMIESFEQIGAMPFYVADGVAADRLAAL